MKSERRHELQTNQLADWLGHKIEKAQPYGKAVLGGLILILAVIAVVVIMFNRGRARTAEGWNAYFAATEAGEVEDLGQIASDYDKTSASVWSRLVFAESRAAEGMQLLYRSRDEGLEMLNTASNAFETLLDQLSAKQKKDPLVAGRVHLQLGRVKEALQQFDAAIENYEYVAKTWPEHAVGERAEWSLDLLSRLRGQDFYTAYYAAPVPTSLGQQGEGMPMEGYEETVEEMTDPSGLEGPTEDFEPLDPFGSGSPLDEFPGGGGLDDLEGPLEGEILPLEGAGADTSPATDTPAAETPATETPASETPAAEPAAEEVPLEAPTGEEPPAPPQ